MADTGLLTTQTFMDGAYTDNELYKAILFDRLDINEGMILENAVAQMLRTVSYTHLAVYKSQTLQSTPLPDIRYLFHR